MTMLLSLDVATTVGWASGVAGSPPQWGARNFAGKGGTGEVIGKFRQWLNQRCYELKPRLIAFESPYVARPQLRAGGPPPMNALTLRRLLAMVGTVEAVAWELRIACREATPAEIAKFFTGRARWGGREQKKAAVIAACHRLGWMVEDDNSADALALWAMAEDIMCPGIRPAVLPVFTGNNPEMTSAPRSPKPRSTQNPRDEENSLDGRQPEFTGLGGDIQPADGKYPGKLPGRPRRSAA